ncbi:PH domain-containing protein [Microbacterium sp. EF45047]|nr:PH domain-containing protein [Microbacterium sp. EF45047]
MTESPTTPPSDPNGFGTPVPPPPPVRATSVPEAPAPGASVPAAPAPAGLDEGTYTQLRTPRSPGAIALDGTWHQISPRYVVSQVVQNILFLVAVVAAAAVLHVFFAQTWAWLPGAALVVITLVTLAILPRQAKAIGYMLREDDIVFRKGILWQRMVAVPYGRMQLVDITQGPLDRAFGISQLKMVTAAATTGVQIPGLTQTAAEALRDTLIEVAETRRTGL